MLRALNVSFVCAGANTIMSKVEVCYKKVQGRDLMIDIHTPDNVKDGKLPVAFYIHGGSWIIGDRLIFGTPFDKLAQNILDDGVMIVAIQYRLCNKLLKKVNKILRLLKKKPIKIDETLPDACYPMPFVDACDAIKFCVKNADEYRIDTERMMVFGASAGAQMALLTALVPEKWEEGSEFKGIDFKFKSITSVCGPCNLSPKYKGQNRLSKMTIRNLLGKWILTFNKKKIRNISPINFVREGLPPLCIVHSLDDELVPVSQAKELAAAWREKGNIVEETYVSGYNHSFRQLKDKPHSIEYDDLYGVMSTYIAKHLK